MRFSRLCSWLLIGSAFAIAMNGCGGTATLVDPTAVEQARQLKQASPAPVVTPPTPTPPPPAKVDARLQVSVKNVKKATLGLGKITATIEVANPSPVTLTGTVKVTFLKKGQATDKIQNRPISLPPNGKQDLTFTESTWFLDNAQADIEMENGGYDPHGGAGRPAGSSYSAPGTY